MEYNPVWLLGDDAGNYVREDGPPSPGVEAARRFSLRKEADAYRRCHPRLAGFHIYGDYPVVETSQE